MQNKTTEMEFPTYRLEHIEITDMMIEALGTIPLAAYKDRDILFVLRDEDEYKLYKCIMVICGSETLYSILTLCPSDIFFELLVTILVCGSRPSSARP